MCGSAGDMSSCIVTSTSNIVSLCEKDSLLLVVFLKNYIFNIIKA